MKLKYKHAHMNAAHMYANLSYCTRKKIGCIIVKGDRPISVGYNGTPAGYDNCCEDNTNTTKPEVVHAELNAIKKLEDAHETGAGAVLFVTVSPCRICAQKIIDFGITHVVYEEEYRLPDGIEYLRQNGILVEHLEALS
jgi:dCMP deaminase